VNELYLLVGAALLLAAVVDILWTALWIDGGAGPLSAPLMSGTWAGIRRLSGDHPRALSLSGPVITALSLSLWIGLLWLGWTVLFAAGDPGLIDTRNAEPVTWSGRFYYVAYSMFTMGNGDFTPAGEPWQIATAFTTATGMLIATMSVTYLLTVLGAVSEKRSFASGVTGLGKRGEALVRSGWDERRGDFHDLDLPLNPLGDQLDALAEQHLSYPILHYYHSEGIDDASPVAVAVLEEAVTILRFGVPEAHRPNEALLESLHASVASYARTLDAAFIEPADRAPPPPDLDRLREAGVPTVRGDEFVDAAADRREVRRKLLAGVRNDEREWPGEGPESRDDDTDTGTDRREEAATADRKHP
jgi:hypothetical protein